ncbi:MAG: class II aldolase/adducin family protein [Betaproteobacteria bacterium]|nr:class II aldolase/adducin family protein [Betaproteobacteria bacterium]
MSVPDALMNTVIKGWSFLYKRGFIEGFGHISARLPDPDEFLITRHSLGPAAAPEDFLVVDMEGRKLAGKGELPGEYPIHLEILKARPEIGSVIHYHGMYSTAFTASEHELRPIHLIGTLFHDGIPIYRDPRLVNNRQRGAALANALGTHRVVLLQAHGVAVTGASVEEAVAGAFVFEENAHRAWLAASLGKPVWIDAKMASDAGNELFKNRGPFRRVWALVESDYDK